jgi:organic hydroperoxide reductase OsmC/OhrA
MMGEVSAHVFQVIVSSSSPHTLLAVGHTSEACHLTSWIHGAQEDGLELEAYTVEEGEYLSSSVEGKGGEWTGMAVQIEDVTLSAQGGLDLGGKPGSHGVYEVEKG